VEPALKGKEKKSWVCSVAGYGQPTADNWKSYFVAYAEAIKARILKDFETWTDFGNGAISSLTQSPAGEFSFGYDDF
jgi:hypothetical protein